VRVAGLPPIAGLSHIDLTVTDVSVSRAFYTEVLGFAETDVTTTPTFTGVVLGRDDLPFTIGLNCCEEADGTTFDEMRTGLDHISFLVSGRDHLEAWEETLRDRGVVFTPIVHVASGDVLVFRDPDNIQLEFFSPSPAA
jgi:glyoxylase I family protein